jgi:hypothetical protein
VLIIFEYDREERETQDDIILSLVVRRQCQLTKPRRPRVDDGIANLDLHHDTILDAAKFCGKTAQISYKDIP